MCWEFSLHARIHTQQKSLRGLIENCTKKFWDQVDYVFQEFLKIEQKGMTFDHDFWLFFSPFLFPPKKTRKEEKKNE